MTSVPNRSLDREEAPFIPRLGNYSEIRDIRRLAALPGGAGWGCVAMAAGDYGGEPGWAAASSRASASATDHAHENAVLADKVMKERAADMCRHEAGDGHTEQAVNREQLLGK